MNFLRLASIIDGRLHPGHGDLIPGRVRFSPHHLVHITMLGIGLFTTTLYLKTWYTASVAYDAPYNDLGLLQQLETFHEVDSYIAHAALHKLKVHLWYLS